MKRLVIYASLNDKYLIVKVEENGGEIPKTIDGAELTQYALNLDDEKAVKCFVTLKNKAPQQGLTVESIDANGYNIKLYDTFGWLGRKLVQLRASIKSTWNNNGVFNLLYVDSFDGSKIKDAFPNVENARVKEVSTEQLNKEQTTTTKKAVKTSKTLSINDLLEELEKQLTTSSKSVKDALSCLKTALSDVKKEEQEREKARAFYDSLKEERAFIVKIPSMLESVLSNVKNDTYNVKKALTSSTFEEFYN